MLEDVIILAVYSIIFFVGLVSSSLPLSSSSLSPSSSLPLFTLFITVLFTSFFGKHFSSSHLQSSSLQLSFSSWSHASSTFSVFLLVLIERRSGGGALIQANARRLGVAPSSVLEGDALTLLPQLPDPDRVLVGGGGRQRTALLKGVIDRLRPGGIVVIPLATLEALAELRPVLELAGLQLRISQQQSWRGQPLAEGTRLAPMNPVLILKGTKPGS